MEAVNLIRTKREGKTLTETEIDFIIEKYVSGDIPDYQISSLLMAVFFRGMNPEETGYLTRAMIDSGKTLDLSDVPGPLIDKHSTGGVGDKVSLILAPLSASCGVRVPMLSGRSLGHTGGTLDKLESIPGYRTDLSEERFKQCIVKTGYSIIGQSEFICPADRKMYALRDATATVESIPLITASILSKKIAEGADGIVFDVKVGSGAFMKTKKQAGELASSLYNTGLSLKKKIVAVLTDMSQPLGRTVGNFLEIREVIDCLQNRGPSDLMDVTLRLTAWMLIMGGISPSMEEALAVCRNNLEKGAAWDRFLENAAFQGGDLSVLKNPDKGPKASAVRFCRASDGGCIAGVEAFDIGMAATLLGAGRTEMSAPVSPGVGIVLCKKRGDPVEVGDILCEIHAESGDKADRVASLVEGAYRIDRIERHTEIVDTAADTMIIEELSN